MNCQCEDEKDPHLDKRPRGSYDTYTPMSRLNAARMPVAVTSLPHVMQLIDEFTETAEEAAAFALQIGDLKMLTRLLREEGDLDIPLDEALALAVLQKDVEAIDAIQECEDECNYLSANAVAPHILFLMTEGDRVVAMHLWRAFYGWIEGGSLQWELNELNRCKLVKQAIELGYPHILNVLLHEEINDNDVFDPEKFDKYLARAVELAESDVWDVFIDEFPGETLEWAVDHDSQAFLSYVVDSVPKQDCVDRYEEAILDNAALPSIQLLHAGSSPLSRQHLQKIVRTAVICVRTDVLDWLMTLDSLEDLPLLVFMSCETTDTFDVLCGLFGHRISTEEMQQVFMNAWSCGWVSVGDLIMERFEITQETRDPAVVDVVKHDEMGALQTFLSMGISADRYEELFKVTTSLKIGKLLVSIKPISREAAALAIDHCLVTKPSAVDFMEWLYDLYSLEEKADVLLPVADRNEATSFFEALLPHTTEGGRKRAFLEAVRDNRCETVSKLTSLIQVDEGLMRDAMQLMRGRRNPVVERMRWADYLPTSALRHAVAMRPSKNVRKHIRRIISSRGEPA